jgi:hypothetical protein
LEYELEKEKKIAENKALLARLKDPEFEKAMEELKKDAVAVKRKKPNPEERHGKCCTSTRFHDGANMWVSSIQCCNLIIINFNVNLSGLSPLTQNRL